MGNTSCEPDLLATFDFETGRPLALLGEMKWGAVGAIDLRIEMGRQAKAFRDSEAHTVKHDTFMTLALPGRCQ
jgi:hypothetical protein